MNDQSTVRFVKCAAGRALLRQEVRNTGSSDLLWLNPYPEGLPQTPRSPA